MHKNLIGIAIKLLAVIFAVIISVLVKTHPDQLPNTQLIFFRCLLALPFVIIFAHHQSGHKWSQTVETLTPKNRWLHIRRSVLGLTSMFLIFYAVRNAPLPIANALKELSPILITMLAAMFLGEKIRIIRTAALLLGVLGVIFITYDTIGGELRKTMGPNVTWGALAALGAAFTIALAQIQIRSMVGSEHPTAIVAMFFVIGIIVTIPFAFFGWLWPSFQGWLWLIMIGCFGGISQLCITICYRYANASTIAPFEYFSIPASLIFGGVLFGEWPHKISLIGMGLILAGGLIIIYREGQLARHERAKNDLQNIA